MAQCPGSDPNPGDDDAHQREALINFFTAALLTQAESGETTNTTMLLVGIFVALLLARPPAKS